MIQESQTFVLVQMLYCM